MKIQGLICKLMLFSAVALAAFTSCKDKLEMPQIYFTTITFHVMQTDEGYVPHFGFEYDGKEELAYGSITHNGMPLELDENRGYKVCQVDPQENMVTLLTDLNGKYTFSAMGDKGHTTGNAEATIDFKGDEDMDEVTFSDLKYVDGVISATFDKVENAKHYGFYLQPQIGNQSTSTPNPTAWYALSANLLLSVQAGTNETQQVNIPFNAAYYENLGITTFVVTPIAYNGLLIRKADQYIAI